MLKKSKNTIKTVVPNYNVLLTVVFDFFDFFIIFHPQPDDYRI